MGIHAPDFCNIELQSRYIVGIGDVQMKRRTDTLNLRVSPEFKELVRLASEREYRTISNLIEVLVRDYCTKHGVKTESGARDTAKSRAI